MFLNETVILVGAGASAEFGLPTGEGIYRSALKESQRQRHNRADPADQFYRHFCEVLRFANRNHDLEQFRNLVSRMARSPAQSIDLFAYYNQSLSEIAKLYTAWALIRRSFEEYNVPGESGPAQVSLLRRTYPWRAPEIENEHGTRWNWLATLANTFLSGARSSEDLAQNRLKIITFNYDSAIEEALPPFIRMNERFSDAEESHLPEVIHVHGRIESLSVEQLSFARIQEQADQVKFISDTIDESSEVVTRAKEVLKSASRIYAVGFAFDPLNLQLLEAGSWGRKAVALNFNGDSQVTSNMLRIGVREGSIVSGSPDRPLTLGAAASSGIFNRKPAA